MSRRTVLVLLSASVLVLSASGCTEEAKRSKETAASHLSVGPSESPPDPHFDAGQKILITKDGYQPEQLVVIVNKEIVWHNETSRPQGVEFSSGIVKSGRIPPGETFTHSPDAPVAISYFNPLHERMTGFLQVEPKEPPDFQ